MTVIIDYGVGNLFSLAGSLAEIGEQTEISGDADTIGAAERLILPGVGAFADAADKLRRSGLDRVIAGRAGAGIPVLGICLGMQLLFEESLEYGRHRGLGLIPGTVKPLRGYVSPEVKIPHIGWEALVFPPEKKSALYEGVAEGEFVYFVHSYYADTPHGFVTANADCGAPVTASVERGNVFGTQFHPEKSGGTGLSILRNFVKIR